MDHRFIEDQDVIGRYRRGELRPEEAEQFETHLIACGTCQGLVEADELLAHVARTGRLAVREPAPTWRRPVPLALAASLALGVIGGGAALHALIGAHQRIDALEATLGTLGQPQGELPTFRLATTRAGTANAFRLRLPREQAWYVLEVEVDDPAASCCRVVIADRAGAVHWTGGANWQAELGTVQVLLARDFLADGTYRVEVYETSPAAPRIATHLVEVQRDMAGGRVR